MQGGVDGRPLGPGQIRFGNTIDSFEKLKSRAAEALIALPKDAAIGIAPHSLRAVTPEALKALNDPGPMHMHLTEQVAEVEAGRAVAGIAGSAFYTLFMAENPPPFACICSRHVSGSPYAAQAALLGVDVNLIHALELMPDARLASRASPRYRFRLRLADLLRALGDTVLPELAGDRRIAALADIEGPSARPQTGLEAALAKVSLEWSSGAARLDLALHFETEGLYRCALEQCAVVADLGASQAAEALRTAGRIAGAGAGEAASPMVRQLLEAHDPSLREAWATAANAGTN